MSSFARITIAVLAVLLALTSSAPAQQAKGKKYALLVGVKDYDHSSLTPLKYTENDVNEFAKVLLGKEAGFAEVVVLTSTGGEKNDALKPTAANIRAQLKKLSNKVKRHDLLIVGLAGHGLQFTVVDPKTKRERYESFFCPADARPQAGRLFEELKKTMLPLGELFKELDESGAGVRLLLVDACRNDISTASRNVDPDFLPRPANGTAVLLSCKSGERAWESPKLRHGVFFFHVIQAFKGEEAKDRRGEITWNSLTDYVINAVADKVPTLIGDGARQTPHEMKNIEGKSPVLLSGGKVVRPAKQDEVAERLFREADDLYQGLGSKFDAPLAFRLYRLAGEKGHPVAQAMAAYLTFLGIGTEANEEEGRAILQGKLGDLESAAEKGDAVAARLLGSMYQAGRAVKPDPVKALAWYRRAIEKEDAGAMNNLALMYAAGLGVKKDEKEAIRWCGKAADKGCVRATTALGWRYALGQGVEKDDREAVRRYLQAARKKYPEAMADLGWMYANGRGVEKDEKEAVRWYLQAADQGGAKGMAYLGIMYAHGMGVEKDEKEAFRWNRKGAELGQPVAMDNLGWMYAGGLGVEKDEKEAVRWYREAANKGEANAMSNLGWMYSNGRGVAENQEEALKWYRKGAALGNATAMGNVGWMYAKGWGGVEKDRAEAIRWYRKAIAAGCKKTKPFLDELEKDR